MTAKRARRSRDQSGYALLALLASSAILLAGLALSIPRMAMQSQRLKDEQLIERGRQYQRAIKLYYRQHNKYPEDLDDLEETDGVRFLRRRYKDPMGETGEWRIIHMGTDGRFEDSLLHDLSRDETGRTRRTARIGSAGMLGEQGTAQDPSLATTSRGRVPASANDPRMGMNQPQSPFLGAGRARTARESAAPDLAARNRYSQGFEFNAEMAAAEEPPGGGRAGERPDYSTMLPSSIPMDENEYQERNPGAYLEPQMRGRGPGQMRTGTRAVPQGLGMAGGTAPTLQSARGGGPLSGAAGSGAAQLINRLLTSPRPGGMAGAMRGQQQVAAAATAQVFERGIAGVASKSEDVGVRVYNGKEAYNEWEFVYDYRKDTDRAGATADTVPPGTDRRAPPGRQQTNRPGRGSRRSMSR